MMKRLFNILKWSLPAFFILQTGTIFSQNLQFKRSSIKTGIGIGYNEGRDEMGLGLVYSIGWQKSYGTKNKFRINPNITCGNFSTRVITDVRDQLYKITTFELNIAYDFIKYKEFAFVAKIGAFTDYTRGLFGTGGWHQNYHNSAYFYYIYYGINSSLSLRIDSPKSRFAYELRGINIYFGNKDFALGYLMLEIDYKFIK